MKRIDKEIEEALQYVYNSYLNDSINYEAFKYFPFKKVEKYILEGFKSLTEGDKSAARRNFYKIGDFFYKEEIPFSFFFDFINKVKYILTKDKNKNCSDIIDQIEDLTEFAQNTFSYGYLVNLIKDDKNWIRDELRVFKGKDKISLLSYYIKDHLIWLNKLLEDIKKLKTEVSVELNPNRCRFGQKLNVGELNLIIDRRYQEKLTFLHNLIHKSASEIYFFLEHRNFKNLLIEYINLIKNVGRLISTLALLSASSAEDEANIDPLTGLLNRRSMEVVLLNQFGISKISGVDFSIGIIDIDNFKSINDTYGHIIGDCVLRQVADRIKNTLRKSDFVFRYGGEEFLVLLPATPKDVAKSVFEKVRKAVNAKPIFCKEKSLQVSISIGEASFSESPDSLEKLIEMADKRLYKAKKTGKNKVVV